MKNPIDNVLWVSRTHLVANDYNPNRQVDTSLDLLVESLRADG